MSEKTQSGTERKRPPHSVVLLRLPPEVKMKLKRLASRRGQQGKPDSMLATVVALIKQARE